MDTETVNILRRTVLPGLKEIAAQMAKLGKITASSLLALGVIMGFAEARTPRSAAEIATFKRENPCPTTQLRRGACPGYQIDHANPICAGGSDTRDNMQWLSVDEHRMKTRSDVRMCRLHKTKKE